jgi:hypothetical protein
LYLTYFVKAYLAYHLDGSNQANVLPASWSSSYQSVEDLVSMVAIEQLLGVTALAKNDDNDISAEDVCRLKRTHDHIYAALIRFGNSTWKNSQVCSLHRRALDAFSAWLGGAENGSSLVSEVSSWRNLAPSPGQMSRGLWIVKPVAQACGRDISVVRGIEVLLTTVAAMRFTCVVQKYIERPLLVRAWKKFDIRQWVLVTNVNPLIIYGFSECYLRLSGRPFSLEDSELVDVNVHLCNHTVNSAFEEACDSAQSVTMMTQPEFEAALESGQTAFTEDPQDAGSGKRGPSIFRRRILPQIRRASVAAVQSCREKFTKVGRGFEWLGVDLMVTAGGDVSVLEVNISPDTSATTVITSRLVEAATRDLFDMLIAEKVADSAAAGVAAVERAYACGSARWDDALGVEGLGAADIVSRNTFLSPVPPSRFEQQDEGRGISSAEGLLLWQLWYVGRHEAKVELDRLGHKKVDKLGKLQLILAPAAAVAVAAGSAEGVAESEKNLQLVSVVCDIIRTGGESIIIEKESYGDAANVEETAESDDDDDEM